MVDHLFRKLGRNNWQVRLDIPIRLRHAFVNDKGKNEGKEHARIKGKPKRVLVKSLKTANRTEAKHEAAKVVAQWRDMFKRIARGEPIEVKPAEPVKPWSAEAFWEDLRAAKTKERRLAVLEQIEIEADRAGWYEDDPEVAQRFIAVATGAVVSIEAEADRWLKWRGYPARSEYQHRRHLRLLLNRHVEVGQVDRRTAAAFVAEVLTPGRDGATIVRMLSTYRQLWRWLKRDGIVEGENPWSEQGPSHHARGKGKRSIRGGSIRRPFTEAEAAEFLASVAGVELDVCRLLAVTGLRIEEACSLLPADVTEAGAVTWLRITDAKTKSGRRRVPVVASEVRAMLRQRVMAGKGAVFDELSVDRFGDRSKPLVMRLARKIRHVADDRALVAGHSWRHRARTLMEAAEVQPWTADWFLGHARGGEGLGRYSKPSDAQLVAAAKAVPLPS